MSIDEALGEIIRKVVREEMQAAKAVARTDDCLLTPKQAAKLLQVSVGFIHAHSKEFPFTVPMLQGNEKDVVRFSSQRLQRWLDQKIKMQEAICWEQYSTPKKFFKKSS